jgi:hypothetical protein
MKGIFDTLTSGQATVVAGLIAGAFIVIGAGINAYLGWLFARWKSRDDAAREMRRLAINAALENWRHQNALKIEVVKSVGGVQEIDAPDAYIIHMLRIMNIAADMKLSAYEAANKISRWSSGEIDSDGAKKQEKRTSHIT